MQKSNFSAFFGSSLFRGAVYTWPPVEKSRSLSMEELGALKYRLAAFDRYLNRHYQTGLTGKKRGIAPANYGATVITKFMVEIRGKKQ